MALTIFTIFSAVILLCIYLDFFPLKCIFKFITGYDCPFCGAQRALNYIMHGNVRGAFEMNPFIFIMSPYIILITLCILNIFPPESRMQKMLYSKWSIGFAATVTLLWWIYRNL